MFNILANMTAPATPASQALWPPKFPSVYLFNFHDRATHKLRHNATIRAAKTGGEIGGHRFQSTDKYFGNCQNQMSLVCCMAIFQPTYDAELEKIEL